MFMRLGQGSQPQFRAFSCSSSNMENKRSKMLQTMTITLLVSIIVMFNFSGANTEPVKRNTNINSESKLQTYIVFVKRPEADVSAQFQDLDGWYKSFLPATVSSSDHHARIVHSYRNVVSGFAAKLTAEEAKSMQGKDDSISVRPEKILSLHTTRSPDFLGLNQNLGSWRNSNFGKGVIIGVLDTGISPDHPSFSDEGMPPPPAKWKGECEFNFTACNNKLIGARNFVTDEGTSPLDQEGHGTHTSSTAAGNFVQDANVFGNANGTAVGMAPLAHLAMYRVCSESGCSESSILAAMDAAVEDGVDILSLSLGGGSVLFSEDSIAVGAFGAIQNGIFVSCSAGNDGPVNQSLSNEAPWILTVGASTIDRSIRSTVKLGNGVEYLGEGLFQPQASTPMFLPLVDAAIVGSQSTLCAPGSLKNIDVKGKIVLCVKGGGIARIAKGQEVKDAGGAGMILMNDKPSGSTILVDVHVLPVSYVSYSAGLNIKAYINSTSLPVAAILPDGTIIGTQTAPAVASFSSRGPSGTSPGILKPDIIGPGVSILAAWSVSVENRTNTKSTFNIVSGTSMSCPHLSGIAALLKSAHPDWSPAAIKSAIMTTAYSVNLQGQPILNERLLPADILAIGAGHVSPSNASDPGLVYDLQPEDYIPYLCGLGYSDRGITYIVQRKVKCSEVKSIPEAQLNYPSFSILFGPNTQSLTYTRTVTNVGPATSSYTAVVAPPSGVNVTITPPTITFSGVNQQATYSVTFSRTGGNVGKAFSQGYLKWLSDRHSVRSAILILFS